MRQNFYIPYVYIRFKMLYLFWFILRKIKFFKELIYPMLNLFTQVEFIYPMNFAGMGGNFGGGRGGQMGGGNFGNRGGGGGGMGRGGGMNMG